jgi:MFS family permease
MGVMSLRYSEKLVMRFGARTTLIPGLVLVAIGLLLFIRAPVDGRYVEHVLPTMVLLALGAGGSFPALMTLAMSGATREDAGLASGLVNTSMQVGGALGLAVLATLSATRTKGLIADGGSIPSALVGGYHVAFAIAAGLIVSAILVAVVVIQPDKQAEVAEVEPQGAEPVYSEVA